MTILELSTIIRELLQCNDYVTLPSMGTFLVEHIPSQIVNEGRSITPPSCEVSFDSSRTEDNESLHRLSSCYSVSSSITREKAEESILSLIKEIKMELLEKAFIEFPQFGTIKFSSDSQSIFEPHPMFDPSAQFYGFEELPIKQLAEPENGTAQESATDNSESGSGFAGDLLKESESAEKVSADDAPVKIGNVTVRETNEKGNGFPLPLWSKLLIVLVLLLVLVVLAVLLFKDELMPLLEKLLYTEEELRFIKEYGL